MEIELNASYDYELRREPEYPGQDESKKGVFDQNYFPLTKGQKEWKILLPFSYTERYFTGGYTTISNIYYGFRGNNGKDDTGIVADDYKYYFECLRDVFLRK